MRYSVQYVRGHVEVYDGCGVFLFSADSTAEAYEMLRIPHGKFQTDSLL